MELISIRVQSLSLKCLFSLAFRGKLLLVTNKLIIIFVVNCRIYSQLYLARIFLPLFITNLNYTSITSVLVSCLIGVLYYMYVTVNDLP